MATNASVDAIAAAVPAPYGPLTRVTNVNALPTPNDWQDVVLTTATSVRSVTMKINELEGGADAIQKAIARALGDDYIIYNLIEALDTANTAIQAYQIASGSGYPAGRLGDIDALLRDVLYVPLSGFSWAK